MPEIEFAAHLARLGAVSNKIVGNIEELARSRLATIGVDALLVDVAKLFGVRPIDLVVVCAADGTMAGVITKTSIVQRIAQCAGSACRTSAASVMTRQVEFCRRDDKLHDVLALMQRRGFQRIPLIDAESHPLGVVIAHDALNAMLSDEEYEGALLRDYVMGIGYH